MSTSRWRSTTWGIRLGDQSFVADSGGYQALITWGRDTRAARGVRHRRHRQLWRRPGACGASSGASCRGSQSGRPAYASRPAGKSDTVDAEVAARSVLAGQSTAIPKTADGAVEMMRQLKVARDSAVKGAHHGDEHAEADRCARAAPAARSPPSPHRPRPAHALRPTPTGSHRRGVGAR